MEDKDMRDAAEDVAKGSDGSSSDSDSDFDEVEVSEEDGARIMELEAALEANPNQYDTHAQHIEVLRRCKMRERTREARRAMQALFPLSEALWLEWVGDELEGLSGEEDIPRIEALLDTAVGDYLSVPLWLQYLGLVRELDPEVAGRTPDGLQKMRDLCERALTAGGLHVTEGYKLWEAYRGFEEALYEESPSPKQADRVRALFHRQMAVPLEGGAETLEAYRQWEQAVAGGEGQFEVPAHVAAAYSKAQKLLELRRPYEAAVAPDRAPDAELLAAYMAYIKAEEKQGDPARVQVLYERALAAFPVTHYLWGQYCSYLEANLKVASVVNQAYARAVRNCPWVGELWANYLRALERGRADEAKHAAIFQQALEAGLQEYEDILGVFLARLDFLRRQGDMAQLRATFQQANQRLLEAFPGYVDRSFRLTQYWADCEAKAGNMPAARAVWEAALKTAAGRYADTWAAYVLLERQLGNTREARGLYKRGYSRRMEEEGQAVLCHSWLRFEREEGSAEDYFSASLKTGPILAEAAATAAAAADAAQAAQAKAAAAKAPKLSKEDIKRMRQERDPNYKAPEKGAERSKGGQKRGAEEQQHHEQPAAAEEEGAMPPPPKRARPAGQAPAAKAQQQAQQPEQEQQQQQPASAAAPPETAAAIGGAHATGAEGPGRAHVTAKGLHKDGPTTAFVKHLADEVGEAELEELFAPCGAITALKLGRDRDSGRSRGFAHIEFADEGGLRKACEMSGQEVHGKHILVARSQPPAGGPGGFGGGRGRGRGGRFGGGRGGRGRGDGGRGDGGPALGGGNRERGGPHQRVRMDTGGGGAVEGAAGSSKPATAFMPRSAALHKEGGGGPPKSNADFRKMMLGGGGGK